MLNNIRNSANRKYQNPRAVNTVTGVFYATKIILPVRIQRQAQISQTKA